MTDPYAPPPPARDVFAPPPAPGWAGAPPGFQPPPRRSRTATAWLVIAVALPLSILVSLLNATTIQRKLGLDRLTDIVAGRYEVEAGSRGPGFSFDVPDDFDPGLPDDTEPATARVHLYSEWTTIRIATLPPAPELAPAEEIRRALGEVFPDRATPIREPRTRTVAGQQAVMQLFTTRDDFYGDQRIVVFSGAGVRWAVLYQARLADTADEPDGLKEVLDSWRWEAGTR